MDHEDYEVTVVIGVNGVKIHSVHAWECHGECAFIYKYVFLLMRKTYMKQTQIIKKTFLFSFISVSCESISRPASSASCPCSAGGEAAVSLCTHSTSNHRA